MAKKSALGIISLLFIISVGGSLPILYFNLIEPRLGVMNAHIGISALEIAAVDDASITLVIKLRIIDPSGKTIVFPKLDLIAFAGLMPLGTAWNPMEWIITPESWLLDFNAILYLRVLRGEDAGLTPLFDALIHESDLPLTFTGNAQIGSLPFNIPPFSFSLAGVSIFDPVGEVLSEIEEEIREDDEDIITEFFDYIQENGVDFEELAQTVSLDAEGLLEFLNKYGINVFALFYYLETGQEWDVGFGIGNNSKIENRDDRLGVKQAINSLRTADPAKDIMTNFLKIAWDLDDREVFNGTPYSRVDNTTYEQTIPFETMLFHVINNFNFNQSYDPMIFSNSFVEGIGFNDVLRDRIGGLSTPGINLTYFNCSIEPTRNVNNEYYNDTTEEWDIIPGVNFTLDPKYEGRDAYYVRLGFFDIPPPLDMEGDGNVSTFSADNLSIYDLSTYNVLNPEASLLWRCDGDYEVRNYELWGNDKNNELTYRASPLWPFLAGLGLSPTLTYYLTPWLPATSLKVIFKTNGTNSQDYWGFRIEEMDFEFDTDP
ncbi:MAG: hypothetical protein HWN67_04290 [Candidatus Helarchaeota archaeon]|nr:hypothetical protein [Candidatus Helarchaeota archaeon]